MALLRAGKADAFALSRDSLAPLMTQLPGSRIVDGSFQQTGVAIAIPKNRPNALAYVTVFLESAKASGSVRRAARAGQGRISERSGGAVAAGSLMWRPAPRPRPHIEHHWLCSHSGSCPRDW
jgi:ABC-type amino acid transport substrate-binding protein